MIPLRPRSNARKQLRALIVEDLERDAELLVLELQRGGYEVSFARVQTAESMQASLQEDWDVVLSDYTMPRFSALAALEVLRQTGRDIPFIIVSGTIGEEAAVEGLKAGAHDFVVKDRLARLSHAIEREVREAHMRRERRDATALLDSLYETAPVGLAFVDRDLRVVRINEKLAVMNGLPAADYLGRRARDLLPTLGPSIEETHRRVLETGRPILDVEISGETPAAPGQRRHWLVNHYPVRDSRGAILGVGSMVVEITERKRAEAERERLVVELAEAVRVRDEFLSIASHELRTPLTPLKLQVNTLLNRVSDLAEGHASREWVEQSLARIARQGYRLERLVGQLLDVSRITAGRLLLDLEPVDLADVVRDAHQRLMETGELARSGCALTLDLAENVVGQWDRLRVEQVVENLLMNALKYGAGAPVTVTAAKDASMGVLVVQDSGIGLSPSDRERIFGRFERAVSSRHYGGLGMGLFIVRQVVDAFGGSVDVESEPGRGAKFIVCLPLVGPPLQARRDAANGRANQEAPERLH
jgi:PAS domain S-box-containing protein